MTTTFFTRPYAAGPVCRLAPSGLPDLRVKLLECRSAVDQAVDELTAAMERMSENPG